MTERSGGPDSPDETLRRGARHLADSHPRLDARLIERIVFESHATLARGARSRTHLPALALKFAADRLRALEVADGAGEGGPGESRPVRVLVESIRNDGISQMAAAFLNALGDGRVEALSAAINPADQVLRTVVDVMEEDGVPVAESYPKPVTDDIARAADVIITMLIEHPFDLRDGQRIEAWDFDDPAGLGTDEVRRIRDRVRRQVAEFLAALPA
ncbi:three-helix bundle dimerization domain-containing protein [Agrococcus sp. TSP3-2-1]|uniref:arsenate reductase/protein-tyrosine-phosphatase family protein n=1 Tax=Agrococcus sp. TSP3-2-1 TaxID=2804583 RepID=UPI003CF604F9